MYQPATQKHAARGRATLDAHTMVSMLIAVYTGVEMKVRIENEGTPPFLQITE
jgi:hypothetical protein